MNKFFDRYKTDRSQEEEGVWVDFGDGIRVKIRRLNSKFSRDTRAKLEKPYATQFRNREYPLDIQEMLLIKQLSHAIIVEWEGVPSLKDPNKTASNDREEIEAILKEYPDFREEIALASMERSTFQEASVREAEGNSNESSSGS